MTIHYVSKHGQVDVDQVMEHVERVRRVLQRGRELRHFTVLEIGELR